MSTKEEKLISVAECALSLILIHGLDGITHSRLSRAAGVSRPWLYKYVGQNKEDIIPFAVDHFGKMFAYMDRPTEKDREKWIEAILSGTERMIHNTEKYPWIIQLYFRYMGTTNLLGDRIDYVKKLYLQKVVQEVKSAFGYDDMKARNIAEAVTYMQLSMSFHWVQAPVADPAGKLKNMINILRVWLNALPPASSKQI